MKWGGAGKGEVGEGEKEGRQMSWKSLRLQISLSLGKPRQGLNKRAFALGRNVWAAGSPSTLRALWLQVAWGESDMSIILP